MGRAVPIEALATLRRRLAALPARHCERKLLMDSTAQLYAISRATLYRLLRGDRRPKDTYRSDRHCTRAMPAAEIERLCEIVAAMKIRTTNRKGRHLSTVRGKWGKFAGRGTGALNFGVIQPVHGELGR